MSEKDMKIMETFSRAVPMLTDSEKERLLAYGEWQSGELKAQRPRQNAPRGPMKARLDGFSRRIYLWGRILYVHCQISGPTPTRKRGRR